ncbi:trimethylamine methyltransferase family protein [bacterium]|nr:trimethylamine methyltransferase family protein [bacterium]
MDIGAHFPDAQAGAEKMMYALLTALGGANGIGGAGQLKEDFCYEQLMVDDEIAGYVKHLIKGAEITDETIAAPLRPETEVRVDARRSQGHPDEGP